MNTVWIYQADRFLTEDELKKIAAYLENFINNWHAHGVKLNASFDIIHNLFVIIKVVEGPQIPTGCSIDASMDAIKEIQKSIDLNFFNRQRIAYIAENTLKHCSVPEFKELVKMGAVDENTLVFDNTITDLADFETKWQTKAKNTWHKMLLK